MSDTTLTLDDCVDRLRDLENDLYSREFRKWLTEQTPALKKAMVANRQECVQLRIKLENVQLELIANKLDRLGPDLAKGLKELGQVLEDLSNFKKALTLISQVLGLAARVIALV